MAAKKKSGLTKKQKTAYLKNAGSCPFCKSKNIEGINRVEVDDGGCWQPIECCDCGKRWNDVYKLVDIKEVQNGR